MENNGTYHWPPDPNENPKKKPDLTKMVKKVRRTSLVLILAAVLAISAMTCFYTVDDKQQAVVTTFGKVLAFRWRLFL